MRKERFWLLFIRELRKMITIILHFFTIVIKKLFRIRKKNEDFKKNKCNGGIKYQQSNHIHYIMRIKHILAEDMCMQL